MTATEHATPATPTPPSDEELLRALIAQAVAAHDGVDLGDPAEYWYRLGQRNAHAHAAGLLVAGPADPRRADAIADRITLLLNETTPTITPGDLYAAALAPYPPASVHPAPDRCGGSNPRRGPPPTPTTRTASTVSTAPPGGLATTSPCAGPAAPTRPPACSTPTT